MTSSLQRFAITLALLGLASILPATVRAQAQCPTYLTQWGSLGSGDGQLTLPVGLAIDAAGDVYVADRNNHRIQKFTSTGGFIEVWGWGVATGTPNYERCTAGCQAGIVGNGNGQFNNPGGVVTDAVGNVYVSDTYNQRIQVFSNTGLYLTQWGSLGTGEGQFNQPIGVATDAFGDIYVTDPFNHRIQKFTNTGAFIEMWGWGVATGASNYERCTAGCQAGIVGSGDGQFDFPIEVGSDAARGVIYVADWNNHRIQKFGLTGNYLTQWGTPGSGDGQFMRPQEIATNAAGNVYVADQGNHRVQKFTGTGTYLCQWGSLGSGDGQFDLPYGVATNAAGEIYVTDFANHRIQKFTAGCSTAGIQAFLLSLPLSAYCGNTTSKQTAEQSWFLHELSVAQKHLDKGDCKGNQANLKNILSKADGCPPTPDNNDKLCDCTAQAALSALVNNLLADCCPTGGGMLVRVDGSPMGGALKLNILGAETTVTTTAGEPADSVASHLARAILRSTVLAQLGVTGATAVGDAVILGGVEHWQASMEIGDGGLNQPAAPTLSRIRRDGFEIIVSWQNHAAYDFIIITKDYVPLAYRLAGLDTEFRYLDPDDDPLAVYRLVGWKDGTPTAQAQGTGFALTGVGDGLVPAEGRITVSVLPNPVMESGVVEYALTRDAEGAVSVFDVSGRRIRVLESGVLKSGSHRLSWDAKDEGGRSAKNGVYFVVVRVGRERGVSVVVVAK